ncbi:MAG TPA: response regulator [Opitutaceae bacterium]|nr:response regulator [Opitutaceae bacterium]
MQPLILVVDDEPAIRDLLEHFLTEAGFAVSTATNGQDASQSIGDRVVDLVLTDVIMPEWNGIDLIVELRKRRPGLPVIAMSGGGQLSREDCLKTARRVGAGAILAKPFTRAQLIATVDLLLGVPGKN